MSLTYKELAQIITTQMSPSQQDSTITLKHGDEWSWATLNFTALTDVLDANHPYFESSTDGSAIKNEDFLGCDLGDERED